MSLNVLNVPRDRSDSCLPPGSGHLGPVDEKQSKFNKLKRRFKKKSDKKPPKGQWLLYCRLKNSVSSGLINPLNKMQLKILNTGFFKIDEEGEKASGIIPQKPFDLSKPKFTKHIDLLLQYRVLLKIEYHVASKGESHSMRHALKEENTSKNAKAKYLPYDYNRVVLETLPGIPESDYINASYIDVSHYHKSIVFDAIFITHSCCA